MRNITISVVGFQKAEIGYIFDSVEIRGVLNISALEGKNVTSLELKKFIEMITKFGLKVEIDSSSSITRKVLETIELRQVTNLKQST